nr:retrovirus-related Pol polyprotein from transposon TNT 1-94 [Tanacetum cinerariifolium]
MTTPNITSSTNSQMHNNIMAAVHAVEATDNSPAVLENTTVETPTNMSPKNKAHFLAEKEAIHLILTGIGDDIYSTVDACQTAQEMWEAIERLQQGDSLNIQDPEWSRFVMIVKQQHKLDEVSYHKLFDMLKQYQNEVNELCAEKLARNANPLTLVATAQASQDPFYQSSRSHRSQIPLPKPSIPSRSHTSTKHKGKEIAKPITPPSETAFEEESDHEQAQRDKDMQKNLALIAKYFKKIYKPTNNNFRTSSNSKNKNVDITPRKPKRVKDSAYHKEKMLLCKQAEQGVSLQVEQYDWLADTDEEVDEQELEVHYSYMAKFQEVPNADSGTNSEPVEHVQNNAGYNVFANLETDDSNVTPDSPDMCEDDIQNEQNDVKSDDEHVALANLIANLKCDVNENKKIQKQLKKANTTLAQELKECKAILTKTSKSLGESISVRDSCLVELQTKQTEFEKYNAFNDRIVDYDKLKRKLNEALGQIAHKDTVIREDLFRAPTAHDMEILIQTCLMPLTIKTQSDSLKFVHELKQEMHADLKYVESLEKEIDELESKKAEFLNMYDEILQDCVSKDVMCSYLQSLSNLDALAELQCMYLHNVKECDCLAQKLAKQTESVSKKVHNELLQRELKKLIEKGNEKSVDTKFDRPSVVRQPNAQRIPKPSVLEVAFRKSTCFVRDLQGNDLLVSNHRSDFYTISLQESTSSTPLCLMAKATPTQAWLWHRRLSHLNFDYINLLSKKDIVIGLPKLKYVKDQLCSSCELSKAKRRSFKSKVVSSSKGRLNLLHMDLCGLMRVASINGKKYILVIVDDYSRYTWTLFLRSKDETPKVLKDFLTMIQRNLQAPMNTVRTDRGTKFLNKTLNAFFKEEGIKHQTSTARTPEQNGVVERRNLDADVPSQQELNLLFGPLYDEFFNAGSNPSTNIHSTSAPSTHTNVHAEENNNDQANKREQLQDNEFINPFCAQAQEETKSSSHNIGNLNVPTFNQPQVYEYRWTKDHSLEQVRRNPSRPVQTRRQLTTDPKMCMYALTMSTAEPKNIKETMADSAWIEAMQEELHQFDRLQAKYTLEILSKHGMDKGQSIGTPMATKPKLDADLSGNPVNQTDYRKAEYVTLSASCAQVMWIRTQLQDYGFNYNKIPLYCDSQSAIAISCNPVQHSRTKHIRTQYHFIKEQVENGIIDLYFVRTEYQLANMFTKSLPEDRFKYLVRQIVRNPDFKEWLTFSVSSYSFKTFKVLSSRKGPCTHKHVVPTGRVVVPTGRYVVPTGRVVFPTDRVISPDRIPTGMYIVPTGRVVVPTG